VNEPGGHGVGQSVIGKALIEDSHPRRWSIGFSARPKVGPIEQGSLGECRERCHADLGIQERAQILL
jgi:hypothetical protein